MLDQSTATIRRLIDRGHLTRVPGIDAVRVPHASVEALLSTGSAESVNLVRELKRFGPCLVVAPESIAEIYRIHVQTAYRMLARGSLRTVEWLWCRRALKSEVYLSLHAGEHPKESHQLLPIEVANEKSPSPLMSHDDHPYPFGR
ncbi:MAG: hypothetical protein M3Y80_07130 [Verrucomicrobiota bacterium]|nr:hypothetical protein [Verrucomicrobiota bacterium]